MVKGLVVLEMCFFVVGDGVVLICFRRGGFGGLGCFVLVLGFVWLVDVEVGFFSVDLYGREVAFGFVFYGFFRDGFWWGICNVSVRI